MKIGIATVDFNTSGDYILNVDTSQSELWEFSRRYNKTKLLDGSVSVVDYGYASGDRDFTVSITRSTQEIMESLRDLVQTYADFTLSTTDGAFKVNADTFSLIKGGIQIRFTAIGDA